MLSALKESKMKTLRVGNGYNLGPLYSAINFNYPQSSLTTDSELPCFTLCLCCILHKKHRVILSIMNSWTLDGFCTYTVKYGGVSRHALAL